MSTLLLFLSGRNQCRLPCKANCARARTHTQSGDGTMIFFFTGNIKEVMALRAISLLGSPAQVRRQIFSFFSSSSSSFQSLIAKCEIARQTPGSHLIHQRYTAYDEPRPCTQTNRWSKRWSIHFKGGDEAMRAEEEEEEVFTKRKDQQMEFGTKQAAAAAASDGGRNLHLWLPARRLLWWNQEVVKASTSSKLYGNFDFSVG